MSDKSFVLGALGVILAAAGASAAWLGHRLRSPRQSTGLTGGIWSAPAILKRQWLAGGTARYFLAIGCTLLALGILTLIGVIRAL